MGSWGGKTHAVDPATNHGRVVNVGTALCGVTVYIGQTTYKFPTTEHLESIGASFLISGWCKRCHAKVQAAEAV